VEGGVEHRDLRHSRTEALARRADALEVGRVVERRQLNAVLDLLQHAVVDEHRAGELLPAVDHAVADGVDVTQGRETCAARPGGDEPGEQGVQRRAMVAQRLGAALGRPALGLEVEERLAADALDTSPGEAAVGVALDRAEVGGDHLEAERGAAAVEDEDVHRALPAPTGRGSPWRPRASVRRSGCPLRG
jgi:hypothetical protein